MELLIPVSLIENFHFLRPLWLLALIPAVLLPQPLSGGLTAM